MGNPDADNRKSLLPLPDELFDEFFEATAHFHGYPAPGVILGCYMVEMAKACIPDDILFEAICETSWCLR